MFGRRRCPTTMRRAEKLPGTRTTDARITGCSVTGKLQRPSWGPGASPRPKQERGTTRRVPGTQSTGRGGKCRHRPQENPQAPAWATGPAASGPREEHMGGTRARHPQEGHERTEHTQQTNPENTTQGTKSRMRVKQQLAVTPKGHCAPRTRVPGCSMLRAMGHHAHSPP